MARPRHSRRERERFDLMRGAPPPSLPRPERQVCWCGELWSVCRIQARTYVLSFLSA